LKLKHGLSAVASLLSFTEKVFNLPPLAQRDKTANNLMNMFVSHQADSAAGGRRMVQCDQATGQRTRLGNAAEVGMLLLGEQDFAASGHDSYSATDH